MSLQLKDAEGIFKYNKVPQCVIKCVYEPSVTNKDTPYLMSALQQTYYRRCKKCNEKIKK